MPARSTPSSGEQPRDAGASAVEFALVLPLLMLFLFGIIQYGYGLFEYQAFNSAVSQAARSAATGIGDCDVLGTTLDDMVEANGLDATKSSLVRLEIVNPDGTEASDTSAAQRLGLAKLTATYTPVDFNLPFVPFPDTFEATRSSSVQDVSTTLAGLPIGGCG